EKVTKFPINRRILGISNHRTPSRRERESSRAAEQTTRYFSADATAIFITNHLSLSLFRSPALVVIVDSVI
ncbi:hypothetical protein SDJN02_04218, partial [Cucurbita argyrosperma subsp. argyrosperma]